MNDAKDSAFPVLERGGMGLELTDPGMLLRDYFAAKAMQSFLMDDAIMNESDHALEWLQKTAAASYEMADAMLEARKK